MNHYRSFLKHGIKGENAGEELMLSLRSKDQLDSSHYFQMIDHFVLRDPKWEVSTVRGALKWYRMGKSGRNRRKKKSREQKNTRNLQNKKRDQDMSAWSGEVDLHNLTRGVAEVKVVDTLLHLRAQWVDSSKVDRSVTNLHMVGRKPKNFEFSGFDCTRHLSTHVQKTVTKVLQTKCQPAIAVDAQNIGRLILLREDLLQWFKGEQAREWAAAATMEPKGPAVYPDFHVYKS